MQTILTKYRHGAAAAAVVFAALVSAGCTTTVPKDSPTAAQQRAEIDRNADQTLAQLSKSAPESRSLVEQAKGVLIFPKVLHLGLFVAGEHGDGVLRVNGENNGYYSTSSGSIGLQAGGQSKAIVYLFMTQDALDKFRGSDGWTVGADASVALIKVGANGQIDSTVVKQPVVSFVLTNSGLAAGVSLQGTKVKKLPL